MTRLMLICALTWFAGPALADGASARLVVELRLQSAALVVTETVAVDPPEGGETGEVVLNLPQGARLMPGQGLVGLTERTGPGGQVSLVATSSKKQLQLRAIYVMQSGDGTFRWRRQLPVSVGRVMIIMPEGGGFELAAGSGLRVSRNVTSLNGKPLGNGGRGFALVEGQELPAQHALEVDVTAAVAVNPVRPLYIAVVVLVIVGFGLLQLGLVLAHRERQRRSEATDAFLGQLLDQLGEAEKAGEAKGQFASRLRKQLQGLLGEH